MYGVYRYYWPHYRSQRPLALLGVASSEVTGTGDATLAITASADGVHGVAGTAAATLAITAAGSGVHGVAGTGAASLAFSAAGAGVHGVAGAGTATLGFTASGSGTFTPAEVTGTGAATLSITATASGHFGADIVAVPLSSRTLTAGALSTGSATAPPLP